MRISDKDYRRLLRRIDSAKAVQRAHAKDWRRFRWLYVYGSDRPAIQRGRRFRHDAIRVNMAHSLIRAQVARLFYRTPRIYVDSTHPPETEDQEVTPYLVAHLLQYLWKAMKTNEEARRCVLDASIFGTGIMKLGFDSEYGIDEAEVTDRIDKGAVVKARRGAVEGIRALAGLPPSRNGKASFQDRTPLEYRDNVVREMPWSIRVSPFDVFVDPEARCFEEARFIVHRFIRPPEAIHNDRRYREIRRKIQGKPLSSLTDTIWDESGDPAFPERDGGLNRIGGAIRSIADDAMVGPTGSKDLEHYGTLYEVWEKEDNGKDITVRVICDELDSPLREEEDPFEMGVFPFEALIFNEVPDRLWGKSDLQDIEPQLLELNQLRQLGVAWERRMCKFITVSKRGALSEADQKKLTSSDPFSHIELDNVQGPLKEAIENLDPARFYPQLLELEERLKRDIRDSIGFSEESLGNPVTGITATASQNARAALDVRMDDKAARVELFCGEVASKILKIVRRFFPPEVLIKVVGEKGEDWLPLGAEDIRREYDVSIEVGSAGKPQDEIKRQQIMQFAEMAAKIAPPTMPVPFDWRRFLMKALYAWGETDPSSILSWPEGMQAPGMMPGMDPSMQGGQPQPGMAGPAGEAGPPGVEVPPEAAGSPAPIQPSLLERLLQGVGPR